MSTPEIRVWEDKLSQAVCSLLWSAPFYGHFLVGMCRTFDPWLRNHWKQPAALGVFVTTRALLKINPLYFFDFPLKEQSGLLSHEVLHIALKHVTRGLKYADRARSNVAADLAVNTILGHEKLPKGALFPEQFSLLPGETFEYYYNNLPDPPKKRRVKTGGSGTSSSAGSEDNSGETYESVYEDWDEFFPEGCSVIDSHDWGDPDDLGETIMELVIEGMVERAKAKNYGSLPAEIKDLIVYREKTFVPWPIVLRRFFGSSRASLSFTKKRPSKRFNTYPGVRMENRGTVLLAVDTSGSITNYELDAFMTEVEAAWRACLADIWVVTCDAKIHEIIHPFRRVDMVSGRGGTSFVPPFTWALDTTQHPPIDGIVYLTDGHGVYPKSQLFPTLWVCTEDGDITCDFGQVLRLPELRP